MKKWISLLLTVCLLAALAIPAAAQGVLVPVEDMKLSVVVPEEFAIFSRQTEKDDPVYEQFSMDPKEIQKLFEERGIYLNTVSPDGTLEIVLTMDDNAIKSFRDMKDKELMSYSPDMEKEYEKMGVEMTDYGIYEHPQMKFLEIAFESPDGSDYARQFYTVHDHKAMNFTMHSYAGPISREQAQILRDLVDSVNLNEEPMTYRDPVADFSITLPENWVRDPDMEDDTYRLAFGSLEEPAASLICTGEDLYEGLEADVKAKTDRKDMDLSIYSKEEVAEIFSAEASQISKVKYNGREYYTAVQDVNLGEDGEKLLCTFHQFLYMDNGWMYYFQLAEPKGGNLHKDLKEILKSVEYEK